MIYDLSDPAFLADPGPTLSRMRAEGPLVAIKLPIIGKIWLTTTDAASRELLKDHTRFARDPKPITGKTLAQKLWFLPGFMTPLFDNMLGKDGTDHKRLRGLVDKAFARTNIDDLRPELNKLANELLDNIDPTQPVDIMAAFAKPLPLQAICVLLGIPEKDRDRIANMIAPISGATNGWTVFKALPGLYRLLRHFRRDFDIVRQSPRAGLISDLVAVEDAGDSLSDDELLAMVVTLFIAGHETTVHLITMAIWSLLTMPHAQNAFHADPDQRPFLVEEVMRYQSPVMMTKPHFATQDTQIGGMPLAKGDQVAALLISANRDGARFEAPDQFHPARRPNAHLGFGHGPHVCLGMQLARAEAQVALSTLFARFPQLRLAHPDDPAHYTQKLGVHGLSKLELMLSD